MKENIENVLKLSTSSIPNIFKKPNTRFPIRATDALRSVVLEAGIKKTDTITSTNLREQLATIAQILNLSENDQDILARFMGHD